MKNYEIIIIGAGPAGLSAAKVLAENNREVLVLEKNKIIGQKVCAGGLTNKDLELGISKKIIEKSFKKIKFHTPHESSDIESDKPFIYTIKRKDLGEWQAEQAKKAGAIIKTNEEVIKIKDNSIILENKEEIRFKFLIGADGSNSIVRKYLNLPEKELGMGMQYITKKKFKNLELFYNAELFGHWYAWIFPHKDYTCIGVAGDPRTTNISKLKQNFDKWLKEKEIDISNAKFEVAPVNLEYRGFKFKNKFLIGDAAGFASALTGEGIYFAMVSGIDIANGIINKGYKYHNIKSILEINKRDEKIVDLLKFNKTLTKIEYDAICLLTKGKLFDKIVLKLID